MPTQLGLKFAFIAVSLALLDVTVASAEPQSPAPAQAAAAHPEAAGGYYIEFRTASIPAYGHSYIAYGRLNGKGQPAGTQYADLHPTGNYALMALGHLVPVPANTQWDPAVLKLPVSSSYRRTLSATQYRNLLAAIHKFRANKQPYWNAVTYNCNTFVGEMAEAVGLKAPSALLPSFAYIPALRDLNEGGGKASQAPRAAGRKASAQATAQ